MTPAPIEQTPTVSFRAQEIRKYHPEFLLQLLEKDGTRENCTTKDGTSTDGTSTYGTSTYDTSTYGTSTDSSDADEVNAATVVCARCLKNKENLSECPKCLLLFCGFCWIIHSAGANGQKE